MGLGSTFEGMADEVPNGEVIYIPTSRIVFDPENPRLPKTIDATDESSVLEYMLRDATLTDLKVFLNQMLIKIILLLLH